jgi:hypothetical protein
MEIDTTSQTPEASAQAILAHLDQGGPIR